MKMIVRDGDMKFSVILTYLLWIFHDVQAQDTCDKVTLRYGANYETYYTEHIEKSLQSMGTACWEVEAPVRTDGEEVVVQLEFLQRPHGQEVMKDGQVTCDIGVVRIKDGNGQSLYNVCSDTSLEYGNIYSITDVIKVIFVTSVNDSIHLTAWPTLKSDVPAGYYSQFETGGAGLSVWHIFLIIFLLVVVLLLVLGLVFVWYKHNKVGRWPWSEPEEEDDDEDPFGPPGRKKSRRSRTPRSPDQDKITVRDVAIEPRPGQKPHGHLPPMKSVVTPKSRLTANDKARSKKHATADSSDQSQRGKIDTKPNRTPFTVKVPLHNITTLKDKKEMGKTSDIPLPEPAVYDRD